MLSVKELTAKEAELKKVSASLDEAWLCAVY